LKRRDWKGVSNFEQNLLQQMMAQALAVQTMKRLRNVTPILCFSEATLSIETVNNKALDVYVVKKESLVRKLLRLDRG
jgi:beta-glucosidase/6-phospho-beta-glucosidase/beta-galactosidase